MDCKSWRSGNNNGLNETNCYYIFPKSYIVIKHSKNLVDLLKDDVCMYFIGYDLKGNPSFRFNKASNKTFQTRVNRQDKYIKTHDPYVDFPIKNI